MKKRIFNFHKMINISLYFLLHAFLLIIPVKCVDDCSGCLLPVTDFNNINGLIDEPGCNRDCRFSVTNNIWFLCSGISDSSHKYYYIRENTECRIKETCHQFIENNPSEDKVVYPTNEYIKSCSSIHNDLRYKFSQLGDFCLYNLNNQGENIYRKPESEYEYSVINDLDILKCKDCINIIEIDERNYYQCIKCVDCPTNYYDKENKTCVQSCQNKKIISDKKRCQDECDSIYKYEYSEENNGETKIYCLKNCPINAKFYYFIGENIPSQCLDKCQDKDYYKEETGQCIKKCNGLYWKEDSKNFFTCREDTSKGCPDSHPYKYLDKVCLKNCADTQLDIFFKKKTYSIPISLSNNNPKFECVNDCNEFGFKTDEESLSCVSDCKNTKNIYNFNNKCIYKCTGYKYTDDTLKCVEKCDNNYYLLNDICYHDKCPEESDKPFANKNNECVACNEDDGFYIFEDEEESPKKCLDSCPEDYFHFHGKNICYKKKDENTKCKDIEPKTYPYYSESNPFECYHSCNEIGEEYKYETDFKCTTEFNCPNYFYEYNGITKCLKDNSVKDDCRKINYLYLRGKECIKTCDEYRILPEENIYDGITKLGECISNLNSYLGDYKFYSLTEKILRKSCPYKRIKNLDADNIEKSSDGTCVQNCPSDYPYLTENNQGVKYCVDNCPNFFYYSEADKILKCVDDCKTTNKKFHFENSKECIDECQKNGIYYYYDESNYICISTCKNNNNENKYSLNAAELQSPQKCLKECNDIKFYYENEKICLPDCGNGFYKSETSNVCVDKCELNEKVIKGTRGNTCNRECSRDEPFYISTKLNVNSNIVYNKCVASCEKEDSKYQFYHYKTKECFIDCPLDAKYKNGKICMEHCPEQYYVESDMFCKIKCENTKYYRKKIINETNNIYIYECINNCENYITSTNECVENCPFGENYIGENRICKSYCDPEKDGKYYYLLTTIENENEKYSIYICNKEILSNKYLIYDTNLTADDCPMNYYKSENEKICYKICKNSPNYPFSTNRTGNEEKELICSNKCEDDEYLYYGEDKLCIKGCSEFQINKIINDEDNSCVSECNNNSIYNFQTVDEKNERHCSIKCNNDFEPRYIEINKNYYNCSDKCTPPYNYVLGNECLKKCPDKYFYETNEKGENICKKKCDNANKLYYYKEDLECIGGCNLNDFIIQDTYECTSYCNSSGTIKYHYYIPRTDGTPNIINERTCVRKCPDNKPFLRENNFCEENCDQNNYNYYLSENKICIEKCPNKMKILQPDKNLKLFECVINCPSTPTTYYEDSDKTCIESCNNSISHFSYYIPSERKCLKECNKLLFYIEGFECLSSCHEGRYSDNKVCKDICPEYRKYFVNEYSHGEDDTQKKCSENCENDYPFVKIEKINEEKYLYKCMGTCDYYKNNTNPKECVDQCSGTNKYYTIDEKGRYVCLESCPDNSPFYLNNTDNISCHEKCPENTYKDINSHECVKNCKTNIININYENNECTYGCSSEQFWSKENDVTYCLDKCNNEYGPYLYYGKECIKSCDSDNMVVDMSDFSNKKCFCKNLYYENSGKTICLNSEICGKNGGDSKDYPYRIYDSNQCSKFCFGLLSPNEDICYLSYNNCSLIENTDLLIINDKLKCDCKYKYYYDKIKKKKICLGKDDECDIYPYIYYNTITKECIEDCGSLYEYDNKCFENCPSNKNPTTGSRICKHDYYWYKEGENDYHFLDQNQPCPIKYPYLIPETKECVDNCTKTRYSSIFQDKCYSSCEAIEGFSLIKIKPKSNSKYFKKALYECQCANKWHYNTNGEIECIPESDSSPICENYKYIIKETKQCVNECPEYYPYFFNGECFESCKNAKDVYQYNVKEKEGSKNCICENLWRYNDENKVICLKDVTCGNGELIVDETKQCFEGEECSDEYPLLFNGRCYKKGNCPHDTKENILNGKECVCENYWFKQDNNNIYCIDKCDYKTHPLQIYSTNECIQMDVCPDDKWVFNYICYDKCPDGTLEAEERNCKCDSNYGFWNIKDGNRIEIECGLSNCPEEKPYYISSTKECISSCKDNNLYEFNKVCYIDKCPDPTVSENVRTNKYTCTIKKYTTATNLDELYKYLKQEIVELYKSVPEGGITYNNFSSTMQVYGINKNDTKQKDLIIRSSLSYINISSCTEKVYENNKMKNSDDIVVVKYDLGNQTEKSLVKPVEYEFINSRTGQVLDMSVCTKNDIIISYSLSDILNYNRKSEKRSLQVDEKNNNIDNIIYEIQKQYYKGKELFSKYNLDTFDINSTLYTDMCYTFEIDGKDLVLEDRVKYLYPYYSLCEENCTYSHVDFDLERIYCNCPLKNQLNLKREHKYIINSYSKENIKSKQKGPTNLPVMTCISKLSEKKSINKNGAFFYSLIILILEFILLLITIFYSYQALKNKINKNKNKSKEEEKIINIDTFENDHKDIAYKTSERSLKAPPKKRIIKNDEINPDDIKLEKKIEEKEINNINNKENDGVETDDPRLHGEESINDSLSKDYQVGILDSIQKEQKLLRLKFELSIQKDKSDIFIILLTEICDKIYLIKTLCLLGKYDMFTIYFSSYLLYHLLLLTFVTTFYNIKTIQNIWNKQNYPGLNIDLGYGLLACIIVWIIYKIFLCILNNEHIIKKYLDGSNNKINNSLNDNLKENNKKFNNLLYKIKAGMIIYFIIEFIVGIICLLYLTTFCAIYTGTKARIFKTYGIALVEVLIIKILYGILLGILRKVGLAKKKRVLYNIAYYFDKFVH